MNGREPTGSRSDWAPMSPEQVRRPALRETGRGRRGYRIEEVDAFLNRVATEVEQWTQRYTTLQNEVYRLRNYYRDQGADLDAVEQARPTRPSPETVEVLARAQAYADQVVADAQAQARSMQAEARAMAETITSQAREDAEKAVQSYRANAGPAYSPDREETERLAAWARSILATMEAVQKQLAAAGEAFDLELTRFAAAPRRALGPVSRHALDDRSRYRL
jgi:DivIVA domain-containing protein